MQPPIFSSAPEGKVLNIAVIGSGISGLSCAWLLSKSHNVTVFEAEGRLGGHTNTVEAPKNTGSGTTPVDTGFIVYNERNYPNLVALFDHLDVATHPTDMGFAVSMQEGAFEYSGSGLSGLLAQPKNLFSPRFWSMVTEIRRFYRQGRALLQLENADEMSLRDLVARGGYSDAFIRDHLLPMAAAIWSTPVADMFGYPAGAFLRFCDNHGLMQFRDRPQWRSVRGGAREYVKKLVRRSSASYLLGRGVRAVHRQDGTVRITDVDGDLRRFDHVVFACHANQTLRLLARPGAEESRLLSCFGYARNRAVLHRDGTLMPKSKRAWASWNYIGGGGSDQTLTVTYWMNALQNLDPHEPYFVTLNPHRDPQDGCIIAEFEYEHPVFSTRSLVAQKQLWRLQGRQNSWFCGAYFGAGFHEDGLQSGLAVAEALGGVRRPWQVENESGRIFPGTRETAALEAAQ